MLWFHGIRKRVGHNCVARAELNCRYFNMKFPVANLNEVSFLHHFLLILCLSLKGCLLKEALKGA